MDPTISVRRATPADGPAYVRLVRALAEFEKLPPPDDAAAARLVADAFCDPPRYELWIAEAPVSLRPAGSSLDERAGPEVAAYAVTFATYSTFRGKPTLFLEDLFVHPDFRRRGVATAVLARLRAEAEARGCGRFEWFVLDWNENAQQLYAGVGAKPLAEWQLWRVDLP